MRRHVWKCIKSPKDRRYWEWSCSRCGIELRSWDCPSGPSHTDMTIVSSGALWTDRRSTDVPWDCDLAVVMGVMGD